MLIPRDQLRSEMATSPPNILESFFDSTTRHSKEIKELGASIVGIGIPEHLESLSLMSIVLGEGSQMYADMMKSIKKLSPIDAALVKSHATAVCMKGIKEAHRLMSGDL